MARFGCISADSHVVEPANVWVDHIEAAYRERAPRVVKENGNDVFRCEGVALPGVTGLSAAGKGFGQIAPQGSFARDVRPGAYDPHARLEDMTADGVDAEVLYASVALFMYAIGDTRFRYACFRAYNSWLAQYCGAHPDRLKGIALVSLDDVAAAIAELQRAKRIGLAGASVALYADDDEVQYHSAALDPFWGAAQDLGLPVSLHILTDKPGKSAGGFGASLAGRKTPYFAQIAGRATDASWVQKSLTVMIFGGVFRRFPRLKVVSAENDAGWAAYFIERMDYLFDRRRSDSQLPIAGGSLLPSDYFRQNVLCTFMRDRSAVLAREQVGLENILWSSDYPHADSTWPRSQEMINRLFQGVPEADKQQIIASNAAKLYGFV